MPQELRDQREESRLRAAMVEALYGTPGAVIGGMTLICASVFGAWAISGDVVLLTIAILLTCIMVFRLRSHVMFGRIGRGSADRAIHLRFEREAAAGAWLTAANVGVFGAWSVCSDPNGPVSILGVAQTMGYLAGIAGRNHSRPYITAIQALTASIPFLSGLIIAGTIAYLMIGAAVAFTLLVTLSSVGSLHEVFVSRFRTMRELEMVATRDPLTGLLNRYAFMKELAARISRGTPTSVLAIDLDGFKHINDVFGHDIGDLLLKEAAERITRELSPQAVTARIGGDEFLVISPEQDESGLRQRAEAIIAAMGEPFIIRNVALRAGVSVGVVAGGGQTAEALLKEADLALYAAKDGGRNRACAFTPELRSSYDDRISIESDLRRAIERGDISLAYQPIIDPDTRRATMAEALLRWTHATRGPVPPSVFVQVAETTGLITALGAWVIETACREAANWPNDIGVSVNLSARQFRADHDLAAVVKAALARAHLAPARLTLEITETAMFDDSDLVRATLARIRKMGVKIALDDFGTGYSSLSYLSELPLDKLKIDRAFTTRIATSDRSYCLLKGVAALARDLGLDLIIEGVETSAQLDLLRGLGVDGVQGYVFAKAMPGDDFRRLCAGRFKPVDAEPEAVQQRRALH